MLRLGEELPLEIDKPAAGGRMIARANGQVVLVQGAIPGERATVRISRLGKGIAFGDAVAILEPSPDRRPTASDPMCGGCLYASITYARQLTLKAQVIADAMTRIARLPWSADIAVRPSPEDGYRMRARAHFRGQRLGWFREQSHALCDIRSTGQLLPESAAALERMAQGLVEAGVREDLEIELSENRSATERVIHLESVGTLDPDRVRVLADDQALTGFTIASPGSSGVAHADVIGGQPRVHDTLEIDGVQIGVARHVLAFFQGNRFLLNQLVTHVVAAMPHDARVVDLYAGAGLFALSAAAVRRARVVAVEGDLVSAADLSMNATALGGSVECVHQSVETFSGRRHTPPDTVVVDPPRTGMSKEAVRGVVGLSARQIVYVSCEVATFARDARSIVDAGYSLMALDAFDLFPNTPHVETVARFERR